MSQLGLEEVLSRLSLTKNDFRLLGLLPLVHVAWADGKVQFGEASVINAFAKEKGWASGECEDILHQWMEKPPPRQEMEGGTRAFAALAEQQRGLGASIPRGSIADILRACHNVMTASGGLFGLRSTICAEEESAIDEVIAWLNIKPAAPWRDVIANLEKDAEAEIPGSEGAFFVGKAPEMLKDPLDLLMTTWRRFGDVSRLKMGPNVVHFIVNPIHIEHVLVTNARNYARDDVAFREVENLLGRGLLTMDGEDWRRRRRLMQPAFHHQKINAMAADMADEVASMLGRWKSAADRSEPLDIAEETSHLALNIVNRSLLRTSPQDSAAFLDAMPSLLAIIARRSRSVLRIPDAVPTPTNQVYRDALRTVDRIVNTTIGERLRSPDRGHDLLSMLLDARDEETGEALGPADLRNEVLTLLLAGHETTAVAIAWTFYLLSKHPTVARELLAEVGTVLGGRTPTAEDVPKLVYTRAVIEESMRLYPPAVMNFRKAIGEDRIGNFTIPAGGTIWMSPYVTHRHPKLWPNPEGFDPARFLPEQGRDRHACAYLPFSAGGRKCIGFTFAMMEMQIAVAMIAQKYALDLVPGFQPELDVGFTLRPRNGIWMMLRPAA